MKKLILLITASLLLLSSFACRARFTDADAGQNSGAGSAGTGDTDGPVQPGAFETVTEKLPYISDLDGDGKEETVDLFTYTGEDEYARYGVVLEKDGTKKEFFTEIPPDTVHHLYIGDLDFSGTQEILFDGDLASYDYLIYAFDCGLDPITFAPDERSERLGEPYDSDGSVFAGAVLGFENRCVVIEGIVDMMGTHTGFRHYSLENGTFVPEDSLWTFYPEDAERALTVSRELTAYVTSDGQNTETITLKPGQKIMPESSDGREKIRFTTEDGTRAFLILTPDADSMWLIGGVPESECFESLPYAG